LSSEKSLKLNNKKENEIMEVKLNDPPRRYNVGIQNQIEISDCGKVRLEADEQITLITDTGMEHDVAAKTWGFYATASVNGRLVGQGFKTAFVRNSFGRYYVMLVDRNRISEFEEYLSVEKLVVEEWLDER
jgi:hypothetical protein